MTDFAADDFQAIAARIREIEAERAKVRADEEASVSEADAASNLLAGLSF